MSKYDVLWTTIYNSNKTNYILSFDDIEKILGFPIDHSFLNCKKELLNYGYEVESISLKNKFVKINMICK